MASNKGKVLAYIGTYTTGQSEGIYIYSFDTRSGTFVKIRTVTGIENPTFLAIDSRRRCLYAVSERLGGRGGYVVAYSMGSNADDLVELNRQPSHGTEPCHISMDGTGDFVLVANYGSGSVSVFPIRDDGSLGEATDVIQHKGSSANPERQQGPHAHSANLSPDGRYVIVADLGVDKLLTYGLVHETGKLTLVEEIKVRPGAGPRHLDFHPSGKYAYVINEIDSTITAFAYDGSSGHLTELQTLSTLPEGNLGANSCADVHVHPSGEFVFGSNRGHDSIVTYRVDSTTGELTLVGHEATQGKNPRNFAIDPGGEFLLAENQDSNTIVTFRIDQRTGRIAPTGTVTKVPSPVCLKFVPLPG